MLKKIFSVGVIFSSTIGIAVANPAPYVGAALGVVTNTSHSVAVSKTASEPANFRGMPINVFVGFGGVVNQNFYLAGEAFGTVATGEFSDNNGLKTSYGYGASVLPGVMLSDHTLAFARAGVIRSRFSNANTTRTGGQVGLGLQTSLTQNVDVRGEYDYMAYGSLNNSSGKISTPRSDAFNLGVIYKFE